MTHPKIQHYVPQFLLKGFAAGRKAQLFVYDKATGKRFRTKPHNVAAEAGFYDIDFPGGIATMEPFLGSLEGRVSKIIRGIRETRTIAKLAGDDRILLAAFVIVQFLRTKQFREHFADLDRKMAESLRQRGIDPEQVVNYRPFRDEEEVKLASMAFLREAAVDLVPTVLAKGWILVRTSKRVPFLIGDHPVALHNERTFGVRGNIGFAVPGIEIYLPLSSEYALYLTCPTNVAGVLESNEKLTDLRIAFGEDDPDVQRLEAGLGPMVRALTQGQLLEAGPENVLHHNALQIRYAERFVFCGTDDFELVEEMIADDSSIRHGPRGEIA
ncbi:MAG: DUF4238 domain-containing protein [Rhodothermia bacterium]